MTGEADVLRSQALAQPDDPARWLAAMEAVKRIEVALAGSNDPRGRKAVDSLRSELQTGVDQAERDRQLLEILVDIRSANADDPIGSATDAAYSEAFRSAGIDVDSLDPAREFPARPRRSPASGRPVTLGAVGRACVGRLVPSTPARVAPAA